MGLRPMFPNKSSVKRYDFLQLLLDAIENEQKEALDNKVDKSSEHDRIYDELKFVTHNKSK